MEDDWPEKDEREEFGMGEKDPFFSKEEKIRENRSENEKFKKKLRGERCKRSVQWETIKLYGGGGVVLFAILYLCEYIILI